MPANFKTYEAQARLIAALVASQKDMKLDFKAIAEYYGSDTTPAAIEHKFRPIKHQAKALRTAVANKVDPKTINLQDKDEIAKYYGESTPDGLQFQFRGIKKDAEKLKNAVKNGENPAAALRAGGGAGPSSASTTPSAKRAASARTPSTANKTPRGGSTPGRGRKKNVELKEESDSDEVPSDYEKLDLTPTKPVAKRRRTTTAVTIDDTVDPANFSTASVVTPETAHTVAPNVASPTPPAARMGSVPAVPLATQGHTPPSDPDSQAPTPAADVPMVLAQETVAVVATGQSQNGSAPSKDTEFSDLFDMDDFVPGGLPSLGMDYGHMPNTYDAEDGEI